MATQDPYTGIPQVAPNLQPFAPARQDAPLAAFGGASGQATERLGTTSSAAGTELFARAMAMQDMNEQTKALQANSKFADTAGDLLFEFRKLSGSAAADAYPELKAKINQARADGAEGLSPYAQLHYEQASRSNQQRLVESAGIHAGEQFKQHVIGANHAAVESSINAVGVAPESDDIFNQNIENIKARAEDMRNSGAPGMETDDQVKDYIFKHTSQAVEKRVNALAHTDIGGATKALDKAVNDGLVDKDTAGKLKDQIESHFLNTTTRTYVPKIFSGEDGRLGDQKVPIENLLFAIRGNEGAGSYNPPHPSTGKYASNHALGAYGIMQSNLQPWLKEAGMPAMSEEQFLRDHDAQDKLAAFKLGQLQDQYGSANKAALFWFTGDPNPDPGRNDGFHTAAWYKQSFNANLSQSINVAKIADVAKAHAEEIAPGNAVISQHLSDAATTEAFRQRRAVKEEQKDLSDTVFKALGPGPDGKVPTKIEDIQDPAVHDAFNSIQDPKVKAKVMDAFRKNAESGGYAKTAETVDTYHEWLGKYRNPEMLSKDEREELLDQSVWELPIPYQYQQKLYDAQQKLQKNVEKNPRIQDVMAENKPTLDAFGIGTHQDKDHKRLHMFQGAFHEAAETLEEELGHPLKKEELDSVAKGLLRKYNDSFFGLGRDKPAFENPQVEDKVRKGLTEAFVKAKGYEPSPEQLQLSIAAYNFNTFYAKNKSENKSSGGQ